MKVCIAEHVDEGFGTIPVGSIWEDDSPYIGASENFEDVDKPKPAKSKKGDA